MFRLPYELSGIDSAYFQLLKHVGTQRTRETTPLATTESHNATGDRSRQPTNNLPYDRENVLKWTEKCCDHTLASFILLIASRNSRKATDFRSKSPAANTDAVR